MATAVGAAPFLIGIEALGHVPVAGILIQFLLVTVGGRADLITYFDLQRFEPARIPE